MYINASELLMNNLINIDIVCVLKLRQVFG